MRNPVAFPCSAVRNKDWTSWPEPIATHPIEPAAKENREQQAYLTCRDSIPQSTELLFSGRFDLNNNVRPVGALSLLRRRQCGCYWNRQSLKDDEHEESHVGDSAALGAIGVKA
jgi:hypothetical protein